MHDPYHDSRAADATSFEIASSDAAETREIAEQLGAEVAARFGPRDERPLTIVLRKNGALVAGLNGVSHWRWLYIRHFYVAPQWRGREIGRGLMARAEAEAQRRACVGIYLDTFDEGAAAFYERLGFSRRGRIDGFPVGFARTFLCKTLQAT
ncbi:MAG TPA: GNAT family N-acetyltransferase [Methylocystis sp.]|nr:GNAT family N-acetyltransferase [Methylocystis sp.]